MIKLDCFSFFFCSSASQEEHNLEKMDLAAGRLCALPLQVTQFISKGWIWEKLLHPFSSGNPPLKQIVFDRDEMSKYSLNEISQAVLVSLKVGCNIIPSLVYAYEYGAKLKIKIRTKIKSIFVEGFMQLKPQTMTFMKYVQWNLHLFEIKCNILQRFYLIEETFLCFSLFCPEIMSKHMKHMQK